MTWLIERTDVTPPLYLADIYGGYQWVPSPHGAIHSNTEAEARTAWEDALELDPLLLELAECTEIREHAPED